MAINSPTKSIGYSLNSDMEFMKFSSSCFPFQDTALVTKQFEFAINSLKLPLNFHMDNEMEMESFINLLRECVVTSVYRNKCVCEQY